MNILVIYLAWCATAPIFLFVLAAANSYRSATIVAGISLVLLCSVYATNPISAALGGALIWIIGFGVLIVLFKMPVVEVAS